MRSADPAVLAPHRTGIPPDATIPSLFRAQARRHPHATALAHGAGTDTGATAASGSAAVPASGSGGSLTYAELDRESDALAHRLRQTGTGPGDVVAVLAPRSTKLVVAVLAVVKCGAAYAALDLAWPQEHLRRVMALAGVGVVVTDDPRDWPATVVGHGVPAGEARGPLPDVAADEPAMVFFTSGTTGTPKAVVCPHRAVVRLLRDELFAGFGPGSAMPSAAAIPWDAFAFELWGMLLTGGTTVLTEGPYLMPETLRSAAARHGVDTVWLTASLFNLFVEEDLAAFTGLRQVITGGERLSPGHVRSFLTAHPDVELVNGYGPVENTVFSTVHRIGTPDTAAPDGIPLGRPVAGTDVYVLDGDEACEPGQAGEICVGGDGLALEYLGRPHAGEPTRAFTTVRLDGQERRLYRTGDRGYRSADGLLRFHGRMDRQVKLRGRRVEPAEVEASAARLPGVASAAVVPVEEQDGTCRALALFYTPAAGTDTAPDEVRSGLAARCPAHLVPDHIEGVGRLPVTAHGKTDRAALAGRVSGAARQDGTPQAAAEPAALGAASAAGEVTALVAAAFADTLGLRRVDPDASFFRLGGTSLDAGRISVRLSRRLGMPVPVSRVVAHPTPRELAVWLHGTEARAEPAAPAYGPADGPADGVRLSHLQAAFCVMHRFAPDDLAPLCPLVWECDGPVDLDALGQALADVERRHEALRSTYVVRNGVPLAVVADAPAPAAPHRLEACEGEPTASARDRLLSHLTRPLAVDRGQVWRQAVVPVADRTLLGIAVHHVAFDGRSQGVLSRDLSTAYRARVRGTAPRFEAPAPSLRQIAAELERQHGRLPAEEQRAYWATELTDLPDLAPPEPAPARARPMRPLSFSVPADSLTACDAVARRTGSTRFTVLLAAFAQALHRVTGQVSLGVGVPVAKRGSEALDRAVGCLLDTVCLPLRELSDDPAAVLGTVRATVRRAFAAQDVPFAEVVRLANPPRTGRNPLYQVMFALQEAADEAELFFSDISGRPLPAPGPRAVAELTVEVRPSAAGGAVVDVGHRPERIGADFADRVGAAFGSALERLPDIEEVPE